VRRARAAGGQQGAGPRRIGWRPYALVVAAVAAVLLALGVSSSPRYTAGGWTAYTRQPEWRQGPLGTDAARWWWLAAGAELLLGVALAPLVVRELG
jgi:hypothetical protein